MKKFLCLFAVCLLLFTGTLSLSGFAASPGDAALIIETSVAPEAVWAEVSELYPDAVLICTYKNIMNGIAAFLPLSSADAISALSGVEEVYLSRKNGLCESDAVLYNASEMTDVSYSYGSGFYGEGTAIAIIDTGFDVTHKLFTLSDTGKQKLKITEQQVKEAVGGKLNTSNFFSNNPDESPYVSDKIPYAFDYFSYDTDLKSSGSHGTHVAGIAAANNRDSEQYGFDGIAPEAQLVLMKVGSDEGGQIEDYSIMSALDDAVSLGVDVINLSFGVTAGYTGTTLSTVDLSKIFKKAEENGILVFCAAGNEKYLGEGSNFDLDYEITEPLAENPDYGLISEPASFSSTVAVASIESEYIVVSSYIQLPDGGIILFQEPSIVGFGETLGNTEAEFVAVPGLGEEEDYKGLDVAGKLVLVERGITKFSEKVITAERHGAVGVIVYNNTDAPELVLMEVTGSTIPSAFISREDGMALDRLKNKVIQIKKSELGSAVSPTGGKISAFSSWGATPDLKLKPDLTAPGGNIYSTFTGGGYGVMSGTSMSAPFASGAAVLLKQKLASDGLDADSDTVRKLLMNTATVCAEDGVPYSPRLQGAGLLNIESALKTGLYLYGKDTGAAKLELGDKLKRDFKLIFTAVNLTDSDIEAKVSALLMTDGYTLHEESSKYFISGSSELLDKSVITIEKVNVNSAAADYSGGFTVVVPANGELTVVLRATLSAAEEKEYGNVFKNGFYLEGFVTLTPTNAELPAVSIPYLGFYGSWSDVPILDRNGDFYSQNAVSYIEEDDDVYILPLGANYFLEKVNSNKKCFAISPNGDGLLDSIGLILQPLRNAIDFTLSISYEDGEVVYAKKNGGALRKAFFNDTAMAVPTTAAHYLWDGSDILCGDYKMPNGLYTLSLELVADYEKATPQVWSTEFYLDTVSPEVVSKSVVYSGGETFLELTFEDNFYVQAVLLFDHETELREIFDKEPGKTGTVRFNLKDFLSSDHFYVEIVDYAMNITVLRYTWDDIRK